MNSAELKLYEESKCFVSFGRECEDFYNNIDFEQFQSLEEMEAFVQENSKYLIFRKDGKGETYLETVLSNNSDRYIINSDKRKYYSFFG